jgi:hypothetical protein
VWHIRATLGTKSKTDESKRHAELLAAEARLGVRFSEAYRDFVTNPKRYSVAVKRISFFPVRRCDWLDDTKKVIAIGKSYTDGDGTLCFKVSRKTVSETVYVWEDGAFTRIPALENRALDDSPRVRLAERLAGAARRCSCRREIRVLEVCKCGRIGAVTDEPYVMTAVEQAEARREFPTLLRAHDVISALRAAKHVVPSGANQLLATADLLDQKATPQKLIASWKKTGMKVTVDPRTVARLLSDD